VKDAFLVGERLYLRPLSEADVGEEYVGWLNDPEVTRFLETGRWPADAESVRAWVRRFVGSRTDLAFSIIDRSSEVHVGNVTLNHIHPIHRTADTGLMLGRKNFWGKGYAREAWSLVIDHGFRRLNLHKIGAGVVAGNDASLAVLRSLGFQVEGTLRQQHWVDGQYRDAVRLGLLDGEFTPGQSGARR
jgi:RimJ/RimL family protein N-acetyltransferase